MEKLNLHSPDFTQENIVKLAELFPNCVTETREADGTLKQAIDFDQLRQELSTSVVEGSQERYQLNWPGKREALLTANAPIAKTLRPCREESVDFDSTQNLFIEGDNLDALKLLQETYLGKVKMIYIDPPYNTGNDFIYEDDFAEDTASYMQRSNQKDYEGNRLVANNESNGRFHSDWLSMMYPRLKLARNLLRDDGIFFLNIGEEEISNSEKILNEVFGDANKISIISRIAKSASDSGKFFAPSMDYILCYAKEIFSANGFSDKVKEELFKKIERSGPRKGEKYRDDVALYQSSLTLERSKNARYFIECPDGSMCIPPEGKRWRVIESSYFDFKNNDMIVFKETKSSPLLDKNGNSSKWNLYTKSYLKDREEKGARPRNYIDNCINRKGADLIKKIGIPFDFSKPIELMKYLTEIIGVEDGDIIMDLFAGSASTAHSVMALNAEDGGQRKFIMVQLPEACDEKSEAYKAGYKTIAEIGKERIRRAGNKIKAENASKEGIANLDIGFRVLKIDSSNMKDIYYTPDAVQQDHLFDQVDNIREGRSAEDLLFQVLLDWGVDLTLPITQETIASKTVLFVDGNALAACFDADIDEAFVKELAARHPLRVVFRDDGFASDSVKINIEQIFKLISPTTEIKVI
jgi:adenine-specific DNA-methyltransferase